MGQLCSGWVEGSAGSWAAGGGTGSWAKGAHTGVGAPCRGGDQHQERAGSAECHSMNLEPSAGDKPVTASGFLLPGPLGPANGAVQMGVQLSGFCPWGEQGLCGHVGGFNMYGGHRQSQSMHTPTRMLTGFHITLFCPGIFAAYSRGRWRVHRPKGTRPGGELSWAPVSGHSHGAHQHLIAPASSRPDELPPPPHANFTFAN